MKKLMIVLFILVGSISLKSQDDSLTLGLSMPAYDWCIMAKLDGYGIKKMTYSPDGNTKMWVFDNSNENIIITAYWEKAPQKGDSKACRDYYYSRSKMSRTINEKTEKYFTNNDFECVEYFYVQDKEGKTSKGCNMFYANKDVWIDIHFTKKNYQEKDSTLFKSVMNSFTLDKNYEGAILENFVYGNFMYQGKKYKSAITYYEETLKANKVKNRLEEDFLIVLIDNLGMCYAFSGDLVKAKSTFEYGLTVKQYPNFYYNLACFYAETDNKDNAIEYLLLAKKFKENVLKGESLPDPINDTSFEKYKNDEKFQKAVEEYLK